MDTRIQSLIWSKEAEKFPPLPLQIQQRHSKMDGQESGRGDQSDGLSEDPTLEDLNIMDVFGQIRL